MLVRPDLSVGAFRVWQRNRDVALRLWPTELIGFLIEPVIVIFALGLGLGQFVELNNGQEYVDFLTPGLLALFPMFAAVFECAWGSYVRLEMQGTFRAIIATPVSVDDVITGELLWGTTRSTLNATYILILATLLSPWLNMVHSPWALGVVPVAIVCGWLFSAISLAFASVTRAMSQFTYFFNLIINPMFWFGGAFFPIDDLPRWAQIIAWFVPLTHAVNLYRGFVNGDLERSLIVDGAWLLVVAAAFYWVALAGMRRRLIE